MVETVANRIKLERPGSPKNLTLSKKWFDKCPHDDKHIDHFTDTMHPGQYAFPVPSKACVHYSFFRILFQHLDDPEHQRKAGYTCNVVH